MSSYVMATAIRWKSLEAAPTLSIASPFRSRTPFSSNGTNPVLLPIAHSTPADSLLVRLVAAKRWPTG